MARNIAILSPHVDDAVLSCWHLLAGADVVQVVNVFVGVPEADSPPGWWDRVNGGEDSQLIMRRRIDEDREALALVGRRSLNLDFLDRQYRPAAQATAPLVDALRAALSRDSLVLAPAAFAPQPDIAGKEHDAGRPHPDHVAVRVAALALRRAGFAVGLYADLPHASALGWPDWVIADGDDDRGRRAAARWRTGLAATGLRPERLAVDVRTLAAEEFAAKLAAVRRYTSQVALLERAFGLSVDDPALLGHEVVWRLPPD